MFDLNCGISSWFDDVVSPRKGPKETPVTGIVMIVVMMSNSCMTMDHFGKLKKWRHGCQYPKQKGWFWSGLYMSQDVATDGIFKSSGDFPFGDCNLLTISCLGSETDFMLQVSVCFKNIKVAKPSLAHHRPRLKQRQKEKQKAGTQIRPKTGASSIISWARGKQRHRGN